MVNSVFVIIGTIIGAGFASGKEIFTFFNVYGIYGLFGIIISEIIIGFIIYRGFAVIIKHNINTYPQFVNQITGNHTFINTIFCNIINIFLLISFIVMVAGFSAYFSQEFNIHYIFGAFLIAFLSFFTFLKNINGIIKINTYFIPCLILIIVLLGVISIGSFNLFEYNTSPSATNWLISSLLYASYNLIIVFPILISLKNYVSNLKQAKIISISVTFFLTLMALILFFLLNYYFSEISTLELPTVYISSKFGNFYKYACGFVILGAIFTTAISSGFGFLNNLNISNRKFHTLITFLMCLLSIILSNMGFSTLLNLLYPILGLLRNCTNSFSIFCKNTLKILHFIDISI